MKSLQTQYNLIKEGKGNKEVFVKSAKAQFPAIPNHYGFNETVNELKHKNILNETMLGIVSAQPTTPDWFKIFNESINEAKAEEKKPTKEVVDMETRGFDYKDKKNIDNVYGEEFLKGFYTEMNDPKNKDKTVEELKEIVAKNLAKDQLHYVKDGQFGTKGVGYTTEHPGLGIPKEAKGKYKSSGYGDLKENKSIKEIRMFHDPIGYDKNAKSQIEVAREILTNAGLSKDEIDDFISNNMFKKGRLDDKAREFVNLKESKLRSAIHKLIKEELNEYGTSDYIYSYEDAVEYARRMSAKHGVVQHVNELPDGRYKVSDWYDSDSTVISFEGGREL